MEYVDGKQLDEYIKKVTGPIIERELTTLFKQILDAIGYAHEEDLVHRDIKPSNIMIDSKGRIKVLDFGIAKMQEEEQGLTKTGVQIGTASYMSPEQVNAKKVDKLSDIYSLGVTLFYMAVGRSPYDEETNTFSIQTKIVSDPLPTASDIYPGVSKKLEAIILKATQKDKKDRYQSCDEFKKDINSKNVVVPKVSGTSTPKHLIKKEKNSKLTLVISVVLLFVIIGFIGFYNNYQTKLETQIQEIKDLRLEKEKIEEERLLEEQEKQRLTEVKSEKEKLAKERYEKERLAEEKAQKERLKRVSSKGNWSDADIRAAHLILEDVEELLLLGEYKSEWVECYTNKVEKNYSSLFMANNDEEGCKMLAQQCNEEIFIRGSVKGNWSYFEKNRFRSDMETVKELDVLGEYKSEWVECYLSKCEENYSSYFAANYDEDGCVMLAEECTDEILEYYN